MGNSVYDRNPALKLDDCVAPTDNTDDNASTTKHGLLPKLDDDASHCLNGDGTWATPPTKVIDFHFTKRTGNDAWYSQFDLPGSCLTTFAPNKDILWAFPLITPKTITLDRMAVYVDTLKALGLVHFGIYNNGTNLYPGSLLLDAGSASTAAVGIASVTVSQQLVVGTLYWLAFVFNLLGGSFWGRYPRDFWSILGQDLGSANGYPNIGWSVAQKFGGCPNPFPVGGTGVSGTSSVPSIFVRLSVG